MNNLIIQTHTHTNTHTHKKNTHKKKNDELVKCIQIHQIQIQIRRMQEDAGRRKQQWLVDCHDGIPLMVSCQIQGKGWGDKPDKNTRTSLYG